MEFTAMSLATSLLEPSDASTAENFTSAVVVAAVATVVLVFSGCCGLGSGGSGWLVGRLVSWLGLFSGRRGGGGFFGFGFLCGGRRSGRAGLGLVLLAILLVLGIGGSRCGNVGRVALGGTVGLEGFSRKERVAAGLEEFCCLLTLATYRQVTGVVSCIVLQVVMEPARWICELFRASSESVVTSDMVVGEKWVR